MTPDQLNQYLQGTPEAQQARLTQQTGQMSQALGANDNLILGKAADAANASFAENGRQGSTGQSNSVLQVGQNLAADRNNQLAQFYGNGLNAIQGQYAGQNQQVTGRQQSLQDYNTQRANQLSDYYLQQNDYNNALNGQQTRNMQSALLGGAFSLGGAALGAYGMGGFGGAAKPLAGAIGSGNTGMYGPSANFY